ncbi:hypothetical protein EYC84_010153 [Monilinia fructicola]|nr:hypothetical protein EYC84_010153 [Monilinia fructicola]
MLYVLDSVRFVTYRRGLILIATQASDRHCIHYRRTMDDDSTNASSLAVDYKSIGDNHPNMMLISSI